MKLEEQIKAICHEFKFWFHDTDHKNELTLGIKYKGVYVFFDKYNTETFRLRMNNGLYGGNPKYKEVTFPISSLEDISSLMELLGLKDVVDYINTMKE